MKVSRKEFISGAVLALVIISLVASIFNSFTASRNNLGILIGFIIIGIISLYGALSDPRVISMNKVFWYFQVVFMSLAPACQYVTGYYPWRVLCSDTDMAIAQVMVIIFILNYYLIYRSRYRGYILSMGRKKVSLSMSIQKYLTTERSYGIGIRYFLLAIGVIGFVLLIRLVGFYNLFIRSENELSIENSTINFVVRKFLTALPAIICAIFIREKNKTILDWTAILILFAITVCSNFPTSTTRYWMGTIFVGLILVLVLKRVESRTVDYGIIIGLLVAFPMFYIFKRSTLIDVMNAGLSYGGVVDSFNTVDFDAFAIVARSVRFVRENGITWGKQLINIVLFFIPRRIWTSKPLTTNVIIAQSQGQTFTNLSCALPAEGYVNFGWVGVLIYAFITAKTNSFFDHVFWNSSYDEKSNIINIIYPFLCIIGLYLNRGPLQPSFIQTIALILPMVVIIFITNTKTEKASNKRGKGNGKREQSY